MCPHQRYASGRLEAPYLTCSVMRVMRVEAEVRIERNGGKIFAFEFSHSFTDEITFNSDQI